mgnify:CR=1 FL=1
MQAGPQGRAQWEEQRRPFQPDQEGCVEELHGLTAELYQALVAIVDDRLGEIRDELGLSGVLMEPNVGGLISPDRLEHSIRLFGQEAPQTDAVQLRADSVRQVPVALVPRLQAACSPEGLATTVKLRD